MPPSAMTAMAAAGFVHVVAAGLRPRRSDGGGHPGPATPIMVWQIGGEPRRRRSRQTAPAAPVRIRVQERQLLVVGCTADSRARQKVVNELLEVQRFTAAEETCSGGDHSAADLNRVRPASTTGGVELLGALRGEARRPRDTGGAGGSRAGGCVI